LAIVQRGADLGRFQTRLHQPGLELIDRAVNSFGLTRTDFVLLIEIHAIAGFDWDNPSQP